MNQTLICHKVKSLEGVILVRILVRGISNMIKFLLRKMFNSNSKIKIRIKINRLMYRM